MPLVMSGWIERGGVRVGELLEVSVYLVARGSEISMGLRHCSWSLEGCVVGIATNAASRTVVCVSTSAEAIACVP